MLAVGAATFLPHGPAPIEGLRAGAYEPPRAAPDFSLRGSAGTTAALAPHRGKVVLLTFGFTNCAAVCPTTLSTLAQARRSLGNAADAVQVIFVTVDPERDTPAGMRAYLAAFDKSFVGATGDSDALAAVRKAYGVTAERNGTGSDYAMVHTSSIFLIDPAGRLRAMMPYGRDPADFVHDIKMLLGQA
ncbi:SCO family protein [Sphingomonas deserti]|uniref:SCO family protein n=1 Tax=Allosphingosinicella deserti TaxID=2116704 RepID=A0A2P7QPS9_9SPHN|nr:SCO family protein [Sphingomonas deserti]